MCAAEWAQEVCALLRWRLFAEAMMRWQHACAFQHCTAKFALKGGCWLQVEPPAAVLASAVVSACVALNPMLNCFRAHHVVVGKRHVVSKEECIVLCFDEA